jgi:hypothetical protein
VQTAVGLFVQLPMSEQPHQEFTNMTLGPGRL